MRYFIDFAYLGTHYHGWQIQENAHSVQAEIEKKLSIGLNEAISVTASGRTDTGVHAEQQIAHLDTSAPLDHYLHLHKFNTLLPQDIVVKDIFQVDKQSHARFDATARTYQYRISKQKNPFLIDQVYYDRTKYNVDLMNEASTFLLGEQNFQAFSKVKTEVNHFYCHITEAFWEEKGSLLLFNIRANRFLRGMVRAIVGTLLEIGNCKINPKDFQKIIESKDRRQAGRAVPPQGLFLKKIEYPFQLISLQTP